MDSETLLFGTEQAWVFSMLPLSTAYRKDLLEKLIRERDVKKEEEKTLEVESKT